MSFGNFRNNATDAKQGDSGMKIIQRLYSAISIVSVSASLAACGLAMAPSAGNPGGNFADEAALDSASGNPETRGDRDANAVTNVGAAPGTISGTFPGPLAAPPTAPFSGATGVLAPSIPITSDGSNTPAGSATGPGLDLPCPPGSNCYQTDTIGAKSDPDHILEPQEIALAKKALREAFEKPDLNTENNKPTYDSIPLNY